MKKFFVFSLCLVFILCAPATVVFAKNFNVPPTSIDQIENGDTYGKGDGEIKIFDKAGNLVIQKKVKRFYWIQDLRVIMEELQIFGGTIIYLSL